MVRQPGSSYSEKPVLSVGVTDGGNAVIGAQKNLESRRSQSRYTHYSFDRELS